MFKPPRVKVQAPRSVPLPVARIEQPLIPPINRRHLLERQGLLGKIRSMNFAISGGNTFDEIVVATTGPALVKLTDVLNLRLADRFNFWLSARPDGSREGGATPQIAPQYGGLPSRRSSIYLPWRGEWEVRVTCLFPAAPSVTVIAQVFDDVTSDMYSAMMCEKPSDIINAQVDVFMGARVRLNDCVNVQRVLIEVTDVAHCYIGANQATYLLAANTPYDFEVGMQSIEIENNLAAVDIVCATNILLD